MSATSAVAVSAPGKVLLAGGYLVLDRAYTGLVFGLDARIHVLIEPIPTSAGIVLNEITVRSPQFLNAVWNYGYRLAGEPDGGVTVTPLRVDADLPLNRNPFVETTLVYVLSYITSQLSTSTIAPASITILADNDYYTTPPLASASQEGHGTGATPRFHNFAVPLASAHKTGLGSSAALVTALTAALLKFYLPAEHFDLSLHDALKEEDARRRLHNLAQAAHCAAQGKVGSGFDVASAVYGSNLYRRFSPDVLTGRAVEPGAAGFGAALRTLVDDRETDNGTRRWDVEVRREAVRVPAGLRLVMCDVAGGSQTPGMVRQVLAWRKDRVEEAAALWTELHSANEALAAELTRLAATRTASSEEWSSAALAPLQDCFARIRTAIRQMSVDSGVPIEPLAQTELIDACCTRVPGVVGGVVPGAGGYDAIALLIEDRQETVTQLRELLRSWQFKGENGEAGTGSVSMLGVREEMVGVEAEKLDAYAEWLA